MSTKRNRKPHDELWPDKVRACRAGIAKALRDIESGELDMAEFEKLNNFCQIALALMLDAGSPAWGRARVKAEWAAYAEEVKEKANG